MTAYYNEFDPKAAAWLRELIKMGLIAPGEVDERSIVDVKPEDLVRSGCSAFCLGEHDTLDTAPRPFRATLSSSQIAKRHSSHVLVYEQGLIPGSLRKTRKPLARLGCAFGTEVGLSLAVAYPLCAVDKSLLALDYVYATLELVAPLLRDGTHQNKLFSERLPALRKILSRIPDNF